MGDSATNTVDFTELLAPPLNRLLPRARTFLLQHCHNLPMQKRIIPIQKTLLLFESNPRWSLFSTSDAQPLYPSRDVKQGIELVLKIHKTTKAQVGSSVHIEGLPEEALGPVRSVLISNGYKEIFCCQAGLWVPHTDLPPEQFLELTHNEARIHMEELPDKFIYDRSNLAECEVSFIDKNWPYHSENSIDYMKLISTNNPYLLVRNKCDNSLAAWVVLHDDWSVGHLFVLPQYRRCGLGRLLVSQFLGDVKDWGKNIDIDVPLFAYIESANLTSQSCFSSLGFQKRQDVYWLTYELS
eukprot:CFRG8495T1